jgi:multiple sugar transport system permease protein
MTILQQKRLLGTIFLGLPLLWLFIFVVVPIFLVFYLSFTEYDILRPPRWIGLFNYEDLWYDRLFWRSVSNTVYYTVVTVPLGMFLSLMLAMFINRQLPGIGFFRTAFYLPVVAPMVAVALVWSIFYDPTIGLFNYILSLFDRPAIGWLNSTQWAMPSIILMSIWKGLGYNMVIFLAGLQAIPRELHEAAAIDGASKPRIFWSVTLPLLTPSTIYVVITSIIASFQVFSQVYVMTNGGPNNSTTTIVHQIYRTAFVHLEMGYASAMALILFVILIVMSLLNLVFLNRDKVYG